MPSGSSPHDALGVPGFSFADLYEPARLRDLYDVFVESVKQAELELWAQWDQHEESPPL